MRRMQAVTRSLALACAMAAISSEAAINDPYYLFLDGTYVRPEQRVPERDSSLGFRVGGGMSLLEDFAGPLSVEGGLFWNPLAQNGGTVGDGKQTGLMVDLRQSFATEGPVNPFLFVGAGAVHETLGPLSGTHLGIEGGMGVVAAVSDWLRVRLSVSAMSVSNSDIPGKSRYLDERFNFGLAVPFGNAPAPVKARVVDADGDGIADAQDKCPNTPASTADGCPPPAPVVAAKDTDGDGIDDRDDTCPGTLEGLKVDSRGCPMESAKIVLKGVNFVTGSADLTPGAKAELDKAADALKAQAGVNVEIGGHTDSLGDAKKNVALSQARADSVRTYLVGKGVDAARLTAKGYGSSQPVADNKTKAGRAENRRVELKVVH